MTPGPPFAAGDPGTGNARREGRAGAGRGDAPRPVGRGAKERGVGVSQDRWPPRPGGRPRGHSATWTRRSARPRRHAVSVRSRPRGAVAARVAPVERPAPESPRRRRGARAARRRFPPSPRCSPRPGEVDPSDRVLEHSIIYALIEIGDPTATARGPREQCFGEPARGPRGARPDGDGADRPRCGGAGARVARCVHSLHRLVDRRPASRVGRRAGGELASAARRNEPEGRRARRAGRRARSARHRGTRSGTVGRAARRSESAGRDSSHGAAGDGPVAVREFPKTWVEPLAAALRDPDASLVREASPPPARGPTRCEGASPARSSEDSCGLATTPARRTTCGSTPWRPFRVG